MDRSADTIQTIVIYRGKLELASEFNSGALQGSDVTDNPVIRDMDGCAILRGESLSGLIRQELIRLAGYGCRDFTHPGTIVPCSCAVCSLMGHSRIPPDSADTGSLQYYSSRLKVSGGRFHNEAARIRHGVAIDRKFAVAAAHKKFDFEALMPGAAAFFFIEIENPSEDETSLIERLFTGMKYGFLSLGGKKGAGLGAFILKECKKRSFDMGARDGVVAYLSKDFQEASEVHMPAPDDQREHFIEAVCAESEKRFFHDFRLIIPFDLWFPGLVLFHDPLEASLAGSDHASIRDKEGNPFLPPSTIRGVLRSRAEQILRTLNPASACDSAHDAFSCAAKLEARKKKEEQKGIDYEPPWEKLEDGTLLCMGCLLFGSAFLGSRLLFQTGAYNRDKSHDEVLQHFVAIDRFTGGAKEGAKYDALPLYNVLFSDCKIIIKDFSLWQIGLLALVMKDVMQSDIRMGFGTRKGYGQAVGIFQRDKTVLLSTSKTICSCRIGDLYNKDTGVDTTVKMFLEKAVQEFRDMVQKYKGTEYENG
ncbi:MAG: hypothetical protein B6D35_14365 [Candidatus Brocadia sp. UTAMX2]|jgi:CRISPR/Cas system CSM-associated protein Csm3 (group 7 of RAMP superfamily)|nr:MAG: hypothetical protein B6D35_14365 [Candidatus Brocadia sp. UTAMX2]